MKRTRHCQKVTDRLRLQKKIQARGVVPVKKIPKGVTPKEKK
jgi:hypothetical protein